MSGLITRTEKLTSSPGSQKTGEMSVWFGMMLALVETDVITPAGP